MGEQDNREKPQVYESLIPATRFVAIATNILESTGETPPESNGTLKIVRWPKDQRGNHYRLQASAETGMWGEPMVAFTLDHFAPDLPANVPKNRYHVRSGPQGIGSIRITDNKNIEKQFDKAAKQEAIRFILGALTDASPEYAAKFLQDAFEHRFASLAGSYVLSDYALEWPTPPMDNLAQYQAYEKYEKQIDTIKKGELKRAKKQRKSIVDPNVNLPQPAYYEAVEEAVAGSRQGPTNMNTYKPVDIQAAMSRIVLEMNGQWRHAIRPETGNYTMPPDAAPEA